MRIRLGTSGNFRSTGTRMILLTVSLFCLLARLPSNRATCAAQVRFSLPSGQQEAGTSANCIKGVRSTPLGCMDRPPGAKVCRKHHNLHPGKALLAARTVHSHLLVTMMASPVMHYLAGAHAAGICATDMSESYASLSCMQRRPRISAQALLSSHVVS